MARAAKRKTKRKMTLAQIYKKAAKEKRPTRFSYDRDGNIVGVYVPMKYKTRAEQKAASRAMVSACSAGAYRQGVSPTKTCGYRGLKPSTQAGRGLAYARWGFPKGWPKPRKVKNPGYNVGSMRVKTFMDEDGDWGYVVYGAEGEPLLINTGEPSEKIAAREGKAEAKFQAEILEIERREFITGNPWVGPDGHTVVAPPPPEILEDICEKGQPGGPLAHWKIPGCRQPQHQSKRKNPRPQAYDPQEGYKFQILCRNQAYDRAWEHCDYATDAADKKHLLENYRQAYGPGWEFKTIMLPAKYWPKQSKHKNPKGTKRVTNVRSLVAKAMK